jgi:hypothetical protein
MSVRFRHAHGAACRFFAATHALNPLEGHLFKNPWKAEKAALRHVTGLSGQKVGQRGRH